MKGVIVPLVIYTAPYIARLMESALLEVENGVVEAYTAMGIKTTIDYLACAASRSPTFYHFRINNFNG